MLAIIGNLHMTELLVIALAALMIFGRRLPEVAMRGAAHVVRLRRSVTKMWREAGLEEELRKVRRDIDREVDHVQRSLPSLTGPEDDEDDVTSHEHWRSNIHADLPEGEDPLAREALDGEPAGEAIRQEGEVDDPPMEDDARTEEADDAGEAEEPASEAPESGAPETGTKESA